MQVKRVRRASKSPARKFAGEVHEEIQVETRRMKWLIPPLLKLRVKSLKLNVRQLQYVEPEPVPEPSPNRLLLKPPRSKPRKWFTKAPEIIPEPIAEPVVEQRSTI